MAYELKMAGVEHPVTLHLAFARMLRLRDLLAEADRLDQDARAGAAPAPGKVADYKLRGGEGFQLTEAECRIISDVLTCTSFDPYPRAFFLTCAEHGGCYVA